MRNKQKAIIVGANSHIAKGLIYRLLQEGSFEIYLYTTHKEKIRAFIEKLKGKKVFIREYSQSFPSGADLIINCIGTGTALAMQGHYEKWFFLLEQFDNLILEYVMHNPKTLYIHFSSGAVYGTLKTPAAQKTVNDFPVNDLKWQRLYGLAKLYAEGKHRALPNYNIVDLRVFAYFSRFVNCEEDYFLANIIKAISQRTILTITKDEMVRDFISPEDLFKLILACLKYVQHKTLNLPIDVCSKRPITKQQILAFFVKNYGLKYRVSKTLKKANSGGVKNKYFSNYKEPLKRIGFTPLHTSLETLKIETAALLKSNQ